MLVRFLPILLATVVVVNVPSAQAPTSVERLGWLQGCWQFTTGERVVEEQWMAPRGGAMLGMSRTVVAGALREYELVVLRATASGLVYEAHPSGQKSAVFPVKEQGETSIVFENLAHDFPQRIGYRRDGDALTAWIEGVSNVRSRRAEFPYRRTACAP